MIDALTQNQGGFFRVYIRGIAIFVQALLDFAYFFFMPAIVIIIIVVVVIIIIEFKDHVNSILSIFFALITKTSVGTNRWNFNCITTIKQYTASFFFQLKFQRLGPDTCFLLQAENMCRMDFISSLKLSLLLHLKPLRKLVEFWPCRKVPVQQGHRC